MRRKTTRRQAERKGRRAEILTILAYLLRGFRILRHRFKTPGGEIDIVAVNRSLVILCEVKARENLIDALEAVTPKSRRRIEAAGRILLMKHPALREHGLRYDIAAVRGLRVQIVEDAWRDGE